jgi:hypothetical protein
MKRWAWQNYSTMSNRKKIQILQTIPTQWLMLGVVLMLFSKEKNQCNG